MDIINLGLVYNILYDGDKDVRIEMTLSTPACPLGDAITDNVKNVIKKHYPDFKRGRAIGIRPALGRFYDQRRRTYAIGDVTSLEKFVFYDF